MFSRRQFLKQFGLGVAAGAMGWPNIFDQFAMPAHGPNTIKIALLADSHLPNASPGTIAARNLMTAVEEINTQQPPVDLVFFAGDLTDNGDNGAIELGKYILSGLDAPCWLLPGEHDISATVSELWEDTFNNRTFSFSHQSVHFLGCNTNIFNPTTGTVDFHYTPRLHGWLSLKLAEISLEAPLLFFSHAPLYRLFQPWQWWTENSESLHNLLKLRQNVYLFHGHVHQNITFHYQNLIFQGLRSTAWPLPDVRVGCTAVPPREFSKAGCGWMLLTINGTGGITLQDQVWI